MTVDELAANPTCSVEQAAALIGVGRGTAYEAIRVGQFPGVLRVGRRIRISSSSLLRYLDGRDEGGGDASDANGAERREAVP